MEILRKDVRDLIEVSRKIHNTLLGGNALTQDETGLVRICATELLANVPEPSPETCVSRREP
jgi:hypothetical protein